MKLESVLKIVYNKPTRKPVGSLLHTTSDTCWTGWIRETKREYETRQEALATERLQNKSKQEAGIKCVMSCSYYTLDDHICHHFQTFSWPLKTGLQRKEFLFDKDQNTGEKAALNYCLSANQNRLHFWE